MASEDAVVAQGLECSLCFELMTTPKLLSCTHTFCLTCLNQLYHCQAKGATMSCPMCRQRTKVPDGDASKLPTNIPIQSLVEDVRSRKTICTVCDPEAKSSAVAYCKTCGEYICDPCFETHRKWKKNAGHEVVSIEDIKSGKEKENRSCLEHSQERLELFCKSCKTAICFRCRISKHQGDGHETEYVGDVTKRIGKDIARLQEEANARVDDVKRHMANMTHEEAKAELYVDEKINVINRNYEESVKLLTDRRNALIGECNQVKQTVQAECREVRKSNDNWVTSITAASDLVGNGVRIVLEGQKLAVHSEVCNELKYILCKCKLDDAHPTRIRMEAEGIKINLEQVSLRDWNLDMVGIFPLSGQHPRSMTATIDGRMAVGYVSGGIEFFDVNGPQGKVLEDVHVRNISILSDGRYVVRRSDNKILLYTAEWEQKDVQFLTLIDGDEDGGMDVDNRNNIFVGFVYSRQIQVFNPEGGDPLLEIRCHHVKPKEVFALNHSEMLVVSDGSTVAVLDKTGAIKYKLHEQRSMPYPLVLYNDSVLVGWMAWRESIPTPHRWVDFQLYDDQLKHGRPVHLQVFEADEYGEKIQTPREFRTGQIAFCTSRNLYVMKKC